MEKWLKKFDWLLFGTALLLSGLGLFSIYSSSLAKGNLLNFKKQLFFLAIGLLVFFLFSFFDYRTLKANSILIFTLYCLSLILLSGLLFLAPEIRGTRSWYKFAFFSFDPIVFTKIILIILLAQYFSTRHIEMYRIRHILISGFYVFLPAFLISRQPNLGSALILIILWFATLIISGIKLRHFLILILIFILFSGICWKFFLKDYQKARVISFLFPQREPLGFAWSQEQAKIAIGKGGFFGGEKVTQVEYGFLPEPQTDFIFAALAERFGFLGIFSIFLLFSLFFWRIIKIALLANNNFSRLLAAGMAISLFAEFFVNIGMNLGLLPIIGISLPFVSYGGSSLVMNFVGLGILQNIFAQNK